MADPHEYLTHRYDFQGICEQCGCPQFGAVNLQLGCPVSDEDFKRIWDKLKEKHPETHQHHEANRQKCITLREDARRRKETTLARSAGKRGRKS